MHLLWSYSKDSCLPGSSMCIKNMLKICDINGYWITTDCPKGTECSIKNDNVACLSSTSEKSEDKSITKDSKIMEQLLKLTKDKSFVEKLKSEIYNENDSEEEEDSDTSEDKNSKKSSNSSKEDKKDSKDSDEETSENENSDEKDGKKIK
ncbi:endochitinase [Vairimorpha apis BRL 01]|uniref:Endochitinase n=1 Tax=Vairimorpha apis BRL 01 TaxID=1037528 RepID=T0L6U2_9MICR|nr:endochitinase [Vairimorpha apis BRL 01]